MSRHAAVMSIYVSGYLVDTFSRHGVKPSHKGHTVNQKAQPTTKKWWYIGGVALLVLALIPSLQQQFELNKQHALAVQACGGVDRIAEVTTEHYRCVE